MIHPDQPELESMDDSGDECQTESEPDELDDNEGNSDSRVTARISETAVRPSIMLAILDWRPSSMAARRTSEASQMSHWLQRVADHRIFLFWIHHPRAVGKLTIKVRCDQARILFARDQQLPCTHTKLFKRVWTHKIS